jgi:hypothetical protein
MENWPGGSPRRTHHTLHILPHGREKSGIASLVDVVVVPHSRLSHALSVAVIAQPFRQWGINGSLTAIAQQGNHIALNQTPTAQPTGHVGTREPHVRA